MGIRSAQVSELVFENCEIPETALLGEEKQGRRWTADVSGLRHRVLELQKALLKLPENIL